MTRWMRTGAALACTLFFFVACSGEPSADRFGPTTQSESPTEEEGARGPVLLAGTGSERRTIAFEQGGPLVFRAEVPKGQRFRAVVHSTRYRLLVFEGRAPFTWPVALPVPGPGPVEVEVTSDGEWSLSVRQPVPRSDDARIPGIVSGKGPAVIPIQVSSDPPVRLIASHRGAGRFEARVFPYEEYAPGFELVTGSGRLDRRVALTQPLQGSYLLAVLADGAWTLRFLGR